MPLAFGNNTRLLLLIISEWSIAETLEHGNTSKMFVLLRPVRHSGLIWLLRVFCPVGLVCGDVARFQQILWWEEHCHNQITKWFAINQNCPLNSRWKQKMLTKNRPENVTLNCHKANLLHLWKETGMPPPQLQIQEQLFCNVSCDKTKSDSTSGAARRVFSLVSPLVSWG